MGMDELKIQEMLKKRRGKDAPLEISDWSDVDPTILIKCISIVTKRGGALRFGYTRDGGAYAIGVYYGGEYFTDYLRPFESIDDYLSDLTSTFESAEPIPEPRAKSKRK